MTAARLTTTVSTKGQVILPKAIREQRRWAAGTQLVVENIEEGILLRAAPLFASSKPEDVFGCLHVPGKKPRTLKEMDEAITAEVRNRHDRGRY